MKCRSGISNETERTKSHSYKQLEMNYKRVNYQKKIIFTFDSGNNSHYRLIDVESI